MSSSTPTIAELRTVTQPASTMGRASAEHWAGRLYMRRVSPYVTRLLLRTGLSANAVTALMIPAGVLAAVCLSLPPLLGAVGAVAFMQLQLLFDCCDGEVARWRGQSGATGIYLDRMAHHITEAALPAALGVHAAGGWGSLDGWTTVGLPKIADTQASAAPRRGALRHGRRIAGFVPFYRAFVPVEFTLLALGAFVVDAVRGDLWGSRVLLIALVPIGVATAVGHFVGVMTSSRLR